MTITAGRYTAGTMTGDSRYAIARGRCSRRALRIISNHRGTAPPARASTETSTAPSKTQYDHWTIGWPGGVRPWAWVSDAKTSARPVSAVHAAGTVARLARIRAGRS